MRLQKTNGVRANLFRVGFPLKSLGLAGLLAVMAVLSTGPLGAQTAARLSGLVQDQSGAAIPGAAVVLRDEASGTEIRGHTDASGFYSFDPVPPKTYSLSVQKEGFKTYVQSSIVVHPADRLDVSVTLQVGKAVERVEVNAEALNVVPTDTGAKTNVLEAREIQNLSTVGRNSMELLTLLPGVVNGGFDATNGSFFGQGVQLFNVNGLRNDQNDMRMDNMHNIWPGDNNGFLHEPNMDMIQEMSVKTSNFEADQGRSPLVIDTITKSGGREYHGEAYWYHRDAALNANDWSNNLAKIPKPNSLFNYLGFNLGGPVLFPHSDFNKNRDKFFFFVGMEWQRQRPDPGTQLATVPSASQRQGNFGDLLNPNFCATDGSGKIIGGRYLKQPCILTDPDTGLPLSGNVIPANKMTASDQAFLSLWPLPNFVDPNGVFNYAAHPLRPLNRNVQHIKLDYNVSENTRIYVNLGHESEKSFQDFGLWGGVNSGWTSNIPEPTPIVSHSYTDSLGINIVKLINPTLTNEFQFSTSATWFPNNYQDPSKISKRTIGMNFTGIWNQPITLSNGITVPVNSTDTVPQVYDQWDYFGGNPGAGRWSGGNIASGVFATNTEFEWMDNVTKVFGAHNLKFGFYADRTRQDHNLGAAVEGRLTTDESWGSTTGDEFGDILTERYKSFEQASRDVAALWRFWDAEWYAQDSWKVSRRLTLNYGARFSWLQPWNEIRGQASTFDPAAYNPSQPTNTFNGLLIAQKGQVPNSIFPSPNPVIQPRLGFAWDVFGKGKSVLRGGFGGFVSRDKGNTLNNISEAPPFSFDSDPVDDFTSFGQIQGTDPFGGVGNLSLAFGAPNRHDRNVPQAYEWSLTWSQSLGGRTVLETSYVGNASRHLYALHDINAVPFGGMWAQGTMQLRGTQANAFRQYKPWGVINQADHSQTANYNALQVTARRTVSQGLTFLATYTWSKTLGHADVFNSSIDPFDSRRNYGLLPYDRAHLLNFSYIYRLPDPGKKYFGDSRIAGGILDDWQLSGVTHYASGAPARVGVAGIRCVTDPAETNAATLALCANYTGDNRTWFGTNAIRLTPIVLSNPRNSVNFTGVGGTWLNPNTLTLPKPGEFGTFEQPTFRSPGFNNWDLTLFKRFRLAEKRELEFRWAAFDIFNRAQLTAPLGGAAFTWTLPLNATSLTQGQAKLANPDTFGKIFNKLGHRQMEVAIKLHF